MSITPEIEAKWRAEFEAIAFPARINLHHNRREIFRRSEDGVYLYFSMEDRWQGFLMARSSVEIGLPENPYGRAISASNSFELAMHKARESIIRQGYKVRVGSKE